MLSVSDGPETSKHLVPVAQRASWSALYTSCLLTAWGVRLPRVCSAVQETATLQVQQAASPAVVAWLCRAAQHLFPCRALDLAATKLSMMAALSSLWLGGSVLVAHHQGRPASAVWPGWREAVQPWLVSAAVPLGTCGQALLGACR